MKNIKNCDLKFLDQTLYTLHNDKYVQYSYKRISSQRKSSLYFVYTSITHHATSQKINPLPNSVKSRRVKVFSPILF